MNRDKKKPNHTSGPMKKTLLCLLMGFTAAVYAQCFIFLDNINNNSPDPLATANGLFWLSTGGTPALINQDFNAAFYGGSTSNSLSLIKTFLLSNGSASGVTAFGPGTFLDPTGNEYPVAGAFTSGFFQVQAWTGNFNSYAAAVAAHAPAAQSPIFVNAVACPTAPPPDLYNMPAMILSGVPEPSTFALAALGGLCALLLRRWRKMLVQKPDHQDPPVKKLILSALLFGATVFAKPHAGQ
jgi:hypothetical protein